MKEKTLLARKYKKWAMKFKSHLLPSTHHAADDAQPIEGYLLEDGIIERDGVRYYYENIRLYYPHNT